MAVFGFCDIRQFTDATEVLQEGVMEFVNAVARIVHASVAARRAGGGELVSPFPYGVRACV